MVGRKQKEYVAVGNRYESNNSGWFVVLENTDTSLYTVQFEDTGSIRYDTRSSAILSGKVGDPSLGNKNNFTSLKKYPVGSEWNTEKYGVVEVLEVLNSLQIKVLFKDTGHIQEGVTTAQLRGGKLINKAELNTVEIELGGRFITCNFGWIEVISIENSKSVTIRFEDTGNVRNGIDMGRIRSGHVADRELMKLRRKFAKEKVEAQKLATQQRIQSNAEYFKSEEYKEECAKYARENYLKNREHIIKLASDYQRLNPDRTRARNQNRRALRKKAEGTHTYEEITSMFYAQDCKCTYCKTDISENRHLDHIIPLSQGGTNYIENLQWLCPTCNLRKSDKLPEVWAKIAEIEFGYSRLEV